MNCDLPSISVIIPSYNHEKFIEEAINSVASQEEANLELIVIDDGSTDGSCNKIYKLLNNFTRGNCEFITQHNMGAHDAINRGISISKGKYLQILNSDDRLHPRRLITLSKLLDKGNSMAFTKANIIDLRGESTSKKHSKNMWYNQAINIFQSEVSIGFGLLLLNAAVSTSNFFFKRELYDKIGGFTDDTICHDWRFLLRALLLVEPVWVKMPLLDYRWHGNNTVYRFMENGRHEGEMILKEYLLQSISEPPLNQLAPSPYWWPGYFETFIKTRRSWFSYNYISSYFPKI